MKDQYASSIIDRLNLTKADLCIDYFKQSLDDPTLLFSIPLQRIWKEHMHFIFFLKLAEGRLVVSKGFGSLLYELDNSNFDYIQTLEIVNK